MAAQEFETPVRTIRVSAKCPECHIGTMEATGVALMSNPPQYQHKCTKCDYHENYRDVRYPYIKHEEYSIEES